MGLKKPLDEGIEIKEEELWKEKNTRFLIHASTAAP